jgi:hypothetical protein
MPRPHQVRDRSTDGDVDTGRCGGWAYEKLLEMDRKFCAAMEKALAGNTEAAFAEWLKGPDEAELRAMRETG